MSYYALGDEYLQEAERYLAMVADFQLFDPKISLNLANIYYQQGKYSRAIEEYKRVIQKDTENLEAIKGLGLSYFKANELTDALRELQGAEIIDPNDTEIIYTIGVIMEIKHLFAEGIQYFNRVINIEPNSIWALHAYEHLKDIELIGGISTVEEIEEEIRVLIMTAPGPEDMPDTDNIVLFDEIQYQILPDDVLIGKVHKLIKILSERGIGVSEIKLPYDSTYQQIQIDLARIINPDGTIIGVKGEDIHEITPYNNFPFYSNSKVLIMSVPGVTVGSIIEYQSTIEDIPGSREFTPRAIDTSFVLASTAPVTKGRIKVSVPVDRAVNFVFKNAEPLEHEEIIDGGMKYLIWRLNDIPKMIVEPMMPPILDISPILYITSFFSWDIIANWWRALALPAIVPDNNIRAEINQLTQNVYSLKDKARALYNYVTTQIRYVGLEYGKGSKKPQTASQVYENKYGDCKNKSILLISMLRDIGIEAYPVLISTLNNGRVWEDIPRINAFNHVISLCIINNEWIWMDVTVEACSFGDIPSVVQGCEALVIFDNGYSLIPVPVTAPEKNMGQEILNINISEDSDTIIESAFTASGVVAIYRRAFFQALEPIYREEYIKTIIASRTTGTGNLIDYEFSNLNDLDQPYRLDFSYTLSDYIEWAGDIGLIEAAITVANKAAITDEERLYPVFLENLSMAESIISINLPDNLEVLYLPPSIDLEIPQVQFSLDYTLENRTIAYYMRYVTVDTYIPIEDYLIYKQFQEQVDIELKRKIIFERVI